MNASNDQWFNRKTIIIHLNLNDNKSTIHTHTLTHTENNVCDGIYSHFARPECTVVFIWRRVRSLDSSHAKHKWTPRCSNWFSLVFFSLSLYFVTLQSTIAASWLLYSVDTFDAMISLMLLFEFFLSWRTKLLYFCICVFKQNRFSQLLYNIFLVAVW